MLPSGIRRLFGRHLCVKIVKNALLDYSTKAFKTLEDLDYSGNCVTRS